MAWYALPFGWGLRGQKTNPGRVNLVIRIDIDPSKHEIQHGMRNFCM